MDALNTGLNAGKFATFWMFLPKSVPLDFGLDKTFALDFYQQYYYPS